MEKLENITFNFMIAFFIAAWYETQNLWSSILVGSLLFPLAKILMYDEFIKLSFIIQSGIMVGFITVLHILSFIV